MKRQIAVLVSALLMGGGSLCSECVLQAQRPKAYMVSDAHLDTQWNWDI